MDEGTQLVVGDELVMRMVVGSELQEQELNAQQMDPTKFERLVENIRLRGALESAIYVHQPGGVGPLHIVSGHHRAKAARAAGVTLIPALVDTSDMPRSLIRAKQIAHNELVGEPDEELLRAMIAQIDNVDDLLITGLSGDFVPEVEGQAITLDLPSAEFDWRAVSLTFLPEQFDRFEELADTVAPHADMIGVARKDQFDAFSAAVVSYGHVRGIKNLSTAVDELVKIALRELEAEDAERA